MSIRFQNILFPTDFSELAFAALAYARRLADMFEARLHCLYVVDEAYQYWSGMGPESIPVGPPPEELLQLGRTRMENFQREHLVGLRNQAVTQVVLGRPFAEIIAYARDNQIDLIVMGTHGRGGIAHVLLGSTTEKVVRKACCAVLTIRAPEQDAAPPPVAPV